MFSADQVGQIFINLNTLEMKKENSKPVENKALNIGVVMPRFFLDKRAGCAAIRDRQHTKYDEDYQGLHSDTPDVVEYKHGFQNHAKKCWDMKPEDIEYLENYCASLNGA